MTKKPTDDENEPAAKALRHLDSVLHSVRELHARYPEDVIAAENRCITAVRAWAPSGSPHRQSADTLWRMALANPYDPNLIPDGSTHFTTITKGLIGVVQALRADLSGDYLVEAEAKVRIATFGGLLALAESLLAPIDGRPQKDPAAVVTGVVLEAHIRDLASKNRLPVTKPDGSRVKAEELNGQLRAKGIIEPLDTKSITTWLQIRNDAVHADWGKFSLEQVDLMLRGVRDFMARFPA